MASHTKLPLGSPLYCAQFVVDDRVDSHFEEPIVFNYFYGTLKGLTTGCKHSLERSGQPSHSGNNFPVVKLYVIEKPEWESFVLPRK